MKTAEKASFSNAHVFVQTMLCYHYKKKHIVLSRHYYNKTNLYMEGEFVHLFAVLWKCLNHLLQVPCRHITATSINTIQIDSLSESYY